MYCCSKFRTSLYLYCGCHVVGQMCRPLDGNAGMATCHQALRWQRNNDRWPFVSIRMFLEIHPFKDEFSLHLYIHKQQLTKSASRTTELVDQVPK